MRKQKTFDSLVMILEISDGTGNIQKDFIMKLMYIVQNKLVYE